MQDTAEVEWSASYLHDLILDLLTAPEVAHVQIIVHSIGTRAVVKALRLYTSHQIALY